MSRTPTLRLIGVAVVLLGSTACAGSTDDQQEATIRVDHALGETVLEDAPERVVALGPGDRDAAIALGVKLVGTVPGAQGDLSPWTEEALDGAEPEILEVSGDALTVDLEAVAELEPDLILASTYYEIDDVYDQLDELAPTLAYQEDPLTDSWDQVARSVGAALDREDAAQQRISDIEEGLQALTDDHEALAGTTYTFAFPTPDGVRVLHDPKDVMNTLSDALGFELTPLILDQPGEGFAIDVPDEKVDLLEADVLALYAPGGEGEEALADNRLFQQLDVKDREAVVSYTDDEFFALRQPTVLALPWSIENVAPRLAEAAQR